MREFYTNGFTKFSVDGLELRGMQIANPKLLYDIPDETMISPSLVFNIRRIQKPSEWQGFFDSPEVGYFERGGRSLYRNCNIICNLKTPEIFYKGRLLPNSYLRITVDVSDKLQVDVEVTANYLRESRSRFTRNLPFDETINNLALVAAIRLGYLPLHTAAILATCSGKVSETVAFMGYPNTGKTTTSVGTRKEMDGEYLAEDIGFYNSKTNLFLSAPFTLDEIKIQDYSVLRSERYFGGPLSTIVMLRRSEEGTSNSLRDLAPKELERFIVEMNRYEFEWSHDSLIRGLFIGGEQVNFDNASISQSYAEMMLHLSQCAQGIELRGGRPQLWAQELKDYLQAR